MEVDFGRVGLVVFQMMYGNAGLNCTRVLIILCCWLGRVGCVAYVSMFVSVDGMLLSVG